MDLSESDSRLFQEAIRLALTAEKEGNLPIGAVISLDGVAISEGRNAIWHPQYNPSRHAEIEALRNVPQHLWKSSRKMTLVTTLEPCLMCLGAILLHRIGRVLYGSADHYGGAGMVMDDMPKYFADEASRTEWFGPAYAQECDELFIRVMKLVEARHAAET